MTPGRRQLNIFFSTAHCFAIVHPSSQWGGGILTTRSQCPLTICVLGIFAEAQNDRPIYIFHHVSTLYLRAKMTQSSSQYHGFWCHNDVMNQSIRSHGINRAPPTGINTSNATTAYGILVVADALSQNRYQAISSHHANSTVPMVLYEPFQHRYRVIAIKNNVRERSGGQEPVGLFVICGFIFAHRLPLMIPISASVRFN